MPPSSPSIPSSVGRYEILRPLGQGAMGRVLLAHDPVLDRHVAIKLLRGDLGLSSEHQRQLFERMRQEARASARVSHPNIVALFDMGQDDSHGLFLVFEYVLGPTLKDRIVASALEVGEAARIASELGDALTTAHASGVLHRDIKPENVILSPTGAKIADFGIARLPESTLTRDGRLLGTPAYSSPESITHGVFTAQSDQFSLAATLYEAISRSRAFPGDDAVLVASSITTTEAEPIAHRCGLNPAVDRVLRRAMHREPTERFSSCAEFGHALATALGGAGAYRETVTTVASKRNGDWSGRAVPILVVAVTLGAILMAVALRWTRGNGAEPSVSSFGQDAGTPIQTSSRSATAPRRHARPATSAQRSPIPQPANEAASSMPTKRPPTSSD